MKSLCAVGGRLGWRKSFFFLARLTWGLQEQFPLHERGWEGPGRGLKVGFWWALGGLLVGFWWAFGGLLVGFWWAFGGLSVGFRWAFGGLLVGFWWAHLPARPTPSL